MSIERRVVLKGTALSIAGFASLPSLAASLATRNRAADGQILALVNNPATLTDAETAFLHGAGSALGSALQMQSVNLSPGVVRALEQQMRSADSLQVIGILEDALATLVVDAARSAGARIRWLSLHQVSGRAIHHRVLNVHADECMSIAATQSAQWLMELGHALASSPTTPAPAPAFEPAFKTLTGSYVSFSIEVGRTPHHG